MGQLITKPLQGIFKPGIAMNETANRANKYRRNRPKLTEKEIKIHADIIRIVK